MATAPNATGAALEGPRRREKPVVESGALEDSTMVRELGQHVNFFEESSSRGE
jgi:hypothetical protein